MEDVILDEVKRDVFEHPKPTLDLDYLYSIKKQVQEFSDQTNSQLKKNVYQNYSLFIESSREISTLKTEMCQLNTLLEQQQASINKLMDHLNKTPWIQPNLERPKLDSFRLELNDDTSEVEAEMLPAWFTKCPEDFDVLIAQRNLKEAVQLAQRVKTHYEQYPKCCENDTDLKTKIDSRIQELIDAICSELQPSTDRSIQGGPRTSISSIQLLRQLNLSAKAVKLYLDQRSSLLNFVLWQQKIETTITLQFVKQICSMFFHHIIETSKEFKQAFEVEKYVKLALEESADNLGIDVNPDTQGQQGKLLFDIVRPVYYSKHPPLDADNSPTSDTVDLVPTSNSSNHLLLGHMDKIAESSASLAKPSRSVFLCLAAYSSLTYWTIQEFDNFTSYFKKCVFNNLQLSTSMVAESVYHLKTQCSTMSVHCEIDMSKYIETLLEHEISLLVEDCDKKLRDTIKKLISEEQWQPQQFQNNAQMTRFFEEMNDVNLKTMPSYIFDDHKLHFTACKTSFARYFLITISDLSKMISQTNKDAIDRVLAGAFELMMESVVDALEKIKLNSRVRFIKGNSNFLLDKVIKVAESQYTEITGLKCERLASLRPKYQAKLKPYYSGIENS